MRRPASISACIVAMLLSGPAAAAGIDSRAYRCLDLQSLIVARGFVFISQPAFGDFAVAARQYCGGGEFMTARAVVTQDRPDCPINYCESRADSDR